MKTSTDSAAGTGLPNATCVAQRCLIRGNSINRLPDGVHEAFVGPMPSDAELFIYVAEELRLPVTITGPRELIESWIVARIAQ